jgi:tripartite-type tricarboxylate transporter receptor subunit TctC
VTTLLMPSPVQWLRLFAVAMLAVCTLQVDARRATPLTLLVGFAAGGGTDVASRLIADHLSESISRPVIVVNRPGAGGRLAAEQLKHARADGNTLLVTPLFATVIAPLTTRGLGYDPQVDFVPVTQILRFDFALAVAANHPARNLEEFIAWARANSTKANFGTLAATSRCRRLPLRCRHWSISPSPRHRSSTDGLIGSTPP